MNFGKALAALKERKTAARAGWNGKGMWLFLVDADDWSIRPLPHIGHIHCHSDVNETFVHELERCPYIAMKTADDKIVPWLASQTDILAEDWETR
jgi:hypothetical protein